MGRWSNERREQEAAKAAAAASEAGRVLQSQRQQASDAGAVEPRGDAPEAAPAVDTAPRPKPRNEPRRMAMEEILSARGEPAGDGETPSAPAPRVEQAPEPTPPDPAVALQTAEELAAAEAKAKQTAEADVPPPEPPKMVKVKVDGEEFDVPQADVDEAGSVRQYQIERATENRLKKTNEALAETRRAQAQMAQYLQQQAIAAQPPKISDADFIKSKVDIVRFGTPEESAAALQEIMQHHAKPVNESEVVTKSIAIMSFNNAKAQFAKEFNDVSTNPLLGKLAQTLENEALQQASANGVPNWNQLATVDWGQFFRNIGNQVRSVAGPRQSQPSPPAVVTAPAGTTDSTSPATSEREARKASIVNLPTAAARAALPQETKPETREETLNQMRKTRGIPTG